MSVSGIRWVIASFFILTACEKEPTLEETLPPISQEGRNVFACIVDDAYVCDVAGLYNPPGFTLLSFRNSCHSGCRAGVGTKGAFVAAYSCQGSRDHFELFVRDSVSVGTYLFDQSGKASIDWEREYPTSSRTTGAKGYIQFLRLDDSVVAGTFEAVVFNGVDSIFLKKGRFDIHQ